MQIILQNFFSSRPCTAMEVVKIQFKGLPLKPPLVLSLPPPLPLPPLPPPPPDQQGGLEGLVS